MGFRSYRGNVHSENGWRIADRNECVTVPGPWMDTAPLRRGMPEIILGDFARRYDAEVAPIVSPVWGFSWDNDVSNSNHLSGTALDINAPQWPWGLRRMPADLVDRIETLVDWYEGAVFWGRNWSKPDEMHFQIGLPEGHSRLDRIVAKILHPEPVYDPRTDPQVIAGFWQLIPPSRWPQ
ncbi:M15 family metallopeptidase [Nocardia wallacei]|uniref:M15 family metallopeptidase n=1 Tax=Nocardia wallacei TaxID=480035 RepID=UPI00245622E2|nr:M15 family metallopeptidase [Nocardia wallacei]